MEEPKFIVSNKGRRILSYKGDLYYKHSENKTKTRTYWICVEKPLCKIYATTLNDDPPSVVNVKDHYHPPSRERVEAKSVYSELKRKAEDEPYVAPAQLIRDIPQHVLPYLPYRETVKRTTAKRRARNYPE